jgi:antitoxin component YwqK of YwqJK toxin-antitoxin module
MLKRILEPIEYSSLYKGEAFTGIGYHVDKDKKIISEQSYFEGMRWGFSRKWRDNNTLKEEYSWRYDGPNGNCKKYYLDGQLKEDFFADHGIVVLRKKWNKEGDLIEDFNLKNSPQHETYNSWRIGKDTPNELTQEQLEYNLTFEDRAAKFEQEIISYLSKYPSNKVYHENDFSDSLE